MKNKKNDIHFFIWFLLSCKQTRIEGLEIIGVTIFNEIHKYITNILLCPAYKYYLFFFCHISILYRFCILNEANNVFFFFLLWCNLFSYFFFFLFNRFFPSVDNFSTRNLLPVFKCTAFSKSISNLIGAQSCVLLGFFFFL